MVAARRRENMQEVQELIFLMKHSPDQKAFLLAVDALAHKLAQSISDIKLQYRMALMHHDDHYARKVYFTIFRSMLPEDKLAALKAEKVGPWQSGGAQAGGAPEDERKASAQGAVPTPKEFSQALSNGRREAAMHMLFALRKHYELRLGFLHNYTQLMSAVVMFKELSQRNGFGNFRLPARNGHEPMLLAESVAKSCIGIIKYWTDNEELPSLALGTLKSVAENAMLGGGQARSMLAAVEFARKQGIPGSGGVEWARVVEKYGTAYGLDGKRIIDEISKLEAARAEYLRKAPKHGLGSDMLPVAANHNLSALAKRTNPYNQQGKR